MSIKAKNSSGYTLVSVSFVLLAMSIVVTSILGFYDANNLNRRLKLTTDKFEIINTALIAYLANNGRFPCPAPLDCDLEGCNNDGAYPEKQLGVEFRQDNDIDKDCIGDNSGVFESTNAVGEKILYGNVPTSSLGLDNNYLIDNWNNKIVYIIPKNLTEKGSARNILQNDSLPNEFVKNGEIYALFSNNINSQGAFPLKSRTSNDYSSLDTSKEENKYILPEKDFKVDFGIERFLEFHRNKHNMHKILNSEDNILQPDCEGVTVNYILSAGQGEAEVCQEFTYIGNKAQPFVVPDGVTQLTIELWGASGGDVNDVVYKGKTIKSRGGKGGYIKGSIKVKPGTTYYVYTGAVGKSQKDGSGLLSFNGGMQYKNNGGGGGATDIRMVDGGTDWRTSGSINSRILVAGGGGGASIPADEVMAKGHGEDGANGCGCQPSMVRRSVSDQKYPGQLCYGKKTLNGYQIASAYMAYGGGEWNGSDYCKLYNNYTYSGGGGYYNGGSTVAGSRTSSSRTPKYVSCSLYTAINYYKMDVSAGGGGGGAGFYSNDFFNVSGSCGSNTGNGKARICYNVGTDEISKTFTFQKAKYGEIVFSDQICPYRVSSPIDYNDFYSLSNHRDDEGKVISNKMAIRCGKNGEWESQTVNNVSELKYVYRCELLDKCSYPREINDEVTWNSNYKGVNTGIVTTSDNKKKMQCIVDDNGNAEWYNI